MPTRAILVVDDEEDMRELLRLRLVAAGHRVATASNGREAVRILGLERFDLVLTDILMPEEDGLELIAAIRASQPDMPIIAMSGGGRKSQIDHLQAAGTFGAKALLEKPFSNEALLRSIALALK
jgi:CheY-like chemotaxis protein